MTYERRPKASNTSQETAGPRVVVAPTSPKREVSVRDYVVAGGLRGFTVDQMFGGAA